MEGTYMHAHVYAYIVYLYTYILYTLNQTLYRPIAGSVNLCPNAVQGNDVEKVIATVKHELLHAMVCSYICMQCIEIYGTSKLSPTDINFVHFTMYITYTYMDILFYNTHLLCMYTYVFIML